MQIDPIWVTIAVYSVFFALFFMKDVSGKGNWRKKGVVTGFIVALYVEMWGFPLSLLVITSITRGSALPYQYDNLVYFFTQSRTSNDIPFYFPSLAFLVEYTLSRGITLFSIPLIVHGWYSLKKYVSKGLVTEGAYRYSRNPQYIGFILFVIGMVLYWPTLLTIPMGVGLCLAYYWLALREEKQLIRTYDQQFKDYSSKVPRFIGSKFLKIFKPPENLNLTDKVTEIILLIPFTLWFTEAFVSLIAGESLIRTYWLPIAYLFPVHIGVVISIILLIFVISATKLHFKKRL